MPIADLDMTNAPFIIGWQEWLVLPELGLPAVKAKIDTGARTSALHAFHIEPFGPAAAPMVRFGVHPIPGRLDVAVFCSAAICDRREVTSSNGEKETRTFIRTPVSMGANTWDIEIGLTNRESMAYRMLLGRQAIRDDMMVDATTSFRQPRLSYKLYRGIPRHKLARAPVRRPLRIALVSRNVNVPFNRQLAETAAARGHVLELLELDKLALTFEDDAPGMLLDGVPLAHYDAVIPRVGKREGASGAALVRQLESMGSVAMNTGDAIDRVANRLAAAQALARDRLPQALSQVSLSSVWRSLVVGDTATAMLSVAGDRARNASLSRHRTERRLAEHAAAALGLELAAIDIVTDEERSVIVRVSARPLLGRFAGIADIDVAADVIDAVEARVRAPRKAMPVGEA